MFSLKIKTIKFQTARTETKYHGSRPLISWTQTLIPLVFDQMRDCVLEDSIKKTLFYLFVNGQNSRQKTRKHNGRNASFVQPSLGSFSEYSRQSDTITEQYPLHLLLYHCLLLSGHAHLLTKAAHCRFCFKTQCFCFEAAFCFVLFFFFLKTSPSLHI